MPPRSRPRTSLRPVPVAPPAWLAAVGRGRRARRAADRSGHGRRRCRGRCGRLLLRRRARVPPPPPRPPAAPLESRPARLPGPADPAPGSGSPSSSRPPARWPAPATWPAPPPTAPAPPPSAARPPAVCRRVSDCSSEVSSLVRLPTIWFVYWLRAWFMRRRRGEVGGEPGLGRSVDVGLRRRRWPRAACRRSPPNARGRGWRRSTAARPARSARFCSAVLYLSSRTEVCCSSWARVVSIWLTCDCVALIWDWFGAGPGSVVDVVAPAFAAAARRQHARRARRRPSSP